MKRRKGRKEKESKGKWKRKEGKAVGLKEGKEKEEKLKENLTPQLEIGAPAEYSVAGQVF